MKKRLLFIALVTSTFPVFSQKMIFSDDFNSHPIGNVSTDLTGANPGVGDWYTYAPASGGGVTSAFQIVSAGATDKALSLTGLNTPTASGTTRYVYHYIDDATTGWPSRGTGQDIVQVDYNMKTGGATTSTNSFNVVLYDNSYRILAGMNFVPKTKILTGIGMIPVTPATNPPSFTAGGIQLGWVNNAPANLTLTNDEIIHVTFQFSTITGKARFIVFHGANFASVDYADATLPSLIGVTPTELDVYVIAGTSNAASATVLFDDFEVSARSCLDPENSMFSYTSASACIGTPNLTPAKFDASVTGVFTSTPSGLSINATTGVIDMTASTAGTYVIKYTTTANANANTTTSYGCSYFHTETFTVNAPVDPAFTISPALCSGITAPVLGLTSTNSITGIWSPTTVSNTTLGLTNYVFTPAAGSCANTKTFPVTVTQSTDPTYTQIPPFCSGATPLPTLPAASNNANNPISGNWLPIAVSNTNIGATTYTFTPAAGGTCINTATMSITVTQTVTPAFTILNNICTGDVPPDLPLSSTNSISGTWNPSTVSNTQTDDYTFTATTGTCIASPVVTVTVNQNPILPAFTPIPAFCSGTPPPSLPTTSTNSIIGTWNSAVSNSTIGQTTYTFTPTAGACATTASLPVTVTETVTPTFTQIPAFCSGAAVVPSLPSASNNLNNAIQGAWSPLTVSNSILGASIYTFTPAPSSGTCVNTATMSITVNTSTVPTFSIPTSLCTGATPPLLPSTSTNLISGSWNPSVVSATASLPYVFTPTGNACLSPLTINITVGQTVTPTFATLAPICLGGTAPLLPTTSTNNVTGTWLPSVVSNLATNTYTFTPTTSCANTYSALVTVSANSVPSFNLSTAICTGASAPILPTTSLELIPGTWSPSIVSNIATGVYVFTPTLGVCASNKTQLITVSAVIVPTFNLPSIVCVGSVAPQLLPVSTNAITGVWSPSSISTTTSLSYLFTPSAGACASLLATSITVSSCAGLEENSVSKYSISPNPSSDVISISFSELSENNGVVKFFSTDGKIIEERNYTNSSVETFDVKSLNAGVYFFQIGNSIEKVVVQ